MKDSKKSDDAQIGKYADLLDKAISRQERQRILRDSILESIVDSPKNTSGASIANRLGITKDKFYGALDRDPILKKIYSEFHEKTDRTIIEKAEEAIVESPPGTSIAEISRKYHFGFQRVLNENDLIRTFYESIHGRKRTDSKTGIKKDLKWMNALKAIVYAPKHSPKSEIAKSAGIPTTTLKNYLSDNLLGKVYHSIHGNGALTAKEEKIMKAILESPLGTSIKEMNRRYKTHAQTVIRDNDLLGKLYYHLHKKVIIEKTGRKPVYRRLDYYMIKKAISDAPRFSRVVDIARSLGVKHNTVLYHMKMMPPKGQPYLNDYYHQIHANPGKENEIRQKVAEAIRKSRTNSTKADIAAKLNGLTKSKAYGIMNEGKMDMLYRKYHPGTKMSDETFERVNRAILRSPQGSSVGSISRKYHLSLTNYLSIPWVAKLYEKRHGPIKVGRHRKN